MRKKSMRSNPWYLTLMAFAFIVAGPVGAAYAKSSYLTSFNSTYPAAPAAIKNCTLCHPGGVTSQLNPYATAYKNAAHLFAPIEASDSDGDTFTNIVEINAGTYPGLATSKPVVSVTLASIAISGPVSVNENGTASYTATATMSDSSTKVVTATWSENSTATTISAAGVLTASAVTASQAVVVSASYTEGGITKTASYNVTVADVPVADTTPPTVTINSPVNAGMMKVNAVTLNYVVSDGTVKVLVDGVVMKLMSGNLISGLANGLHTVRVESTDAAGNVGSNEVSFTVDVEPMFAAAIADKNGNAVPEVAVLLRDYTSGGSIAYLKDGSTKTLLGKVNLGTVYQPKGLCAVADMNANGSQELAMLGKSATANAVIIKDSTSGATLKTLAFPVTYEPVALAQVPDVNGNGSNELAMLGVGATGGVAVIVKDIASGAVVKTVAFPSTLKPLALAVVADVNGNSAPELAVLSAGGGQAKVFIKDALSAAAVKTMAIPATVTPLSLVAVPDVSGNGADEIAVIVANASGQFIGMLKDAFTGLGVKNLSVAPKTSVPQAVAHVGDVNGNAGAEIGVLGLSATGAVSFTMKDASAGLATGTVSYPARTM